ncbi:MAG: carboxypeptidase regulatory-like domain-containing protein [Planctomycetales bacterium]|nr:carboxypeptidase regulatory-like domain-containing protein [Planctomycetales bacterium]
MTQQDYSLPGLERIHAKRMLSWIALVLVSAGGCQEPDNGVDVQGAVTYQGRAVPRGIVSFSPTSGRPINAQIDDAGKYAVRLPPGEYRVTVTLSTELPEGWKEGDPLPRPKVKLPPIYSNPVKTPLTATIAADQATPVDIELK